MVAGKAVEKLEGTLQSLQEVTGGIRLMVLQDGRRYPENITFWGDLLRKEVQQANLQPRARVFVEYTLSDRTTRTGVPYKDGVSVKVIGDEDAPPWEEPGDQAEPEARPKARYEDGVAWGAAQHAASRILAAYIVSKGVLPGTDTIEKMEAALIALTQAIYQGREDTPGGKA